MAHKKTTIPGVLNRVDLVQEHYPDSLEKLRRIEVAAAAGDALDAYALLWSARRWREGRAETLPEEPDRDERGLRMEMVY